MYILFMFVLFSVMPAMAYLDTTPKDFSKPTKMKSHAYVYQRPQYEKYIDIAAEKIAPRVFSSVVGGPASATFNLLDKVTEK